MAKLFVILFTALLLFSNISSGQNAIPSGTARYEALGYNPFITDASIDLNRNPSWGSTYRNYIFGDIGRNTVNGYQLTDQFAAVNFGVSKEITLGVVLNKREDLYNNFIGDPTYDSARINQPIVPFKVLFDWSNGNISLGFAPYYTSWSDDYRFAPTNDTTALQTKKSSYSFGATAGILAMVDKLSWIEGSVDFKMNMFSKEDIGTLNQTIDNDGGMQFTIGTRGFFVVDKKSNFSIVPYLGFGMYSWNPTNSMDTSLLPQYSQWKFDGGIGINTKVLDHGMFAGGLSFGYQSVETEQVNLSAANTNTTTYFILPKFNLGLEWNFTDWIQGRMGYSRSVTSRDDEWKTQNLTQEYSQTVASDPDQTITLGLGFQFGRFSLDGTIGEKFFKEGFYVISGKSNEMFGILSASYNFNK